MPLALAEREEISRGIATEESGHAIGVRIGRHYSVVNREIARNGGRHAYRAGAAHANASVSAARPKERKLEASPALAEQVNAGLERDWSPQQIAARLAVDFADDEAMRVSHEAIYQALFVQAKGRLKAQLVSRLRSGRTRRVTRAERRAAVVKTQAIPDMVMITDRPAEVADRGAGPLGG